MTRSTPAGFVVMAHSAEGGESIAHDKKLAICVIVRIMAGRAMDITITICVQADWYCRSELRIWQGVIIVERYRMVVGNVQANIGSPVGCYFPGHLYPFRRL